MKLNMYCLAGFLTLFPLNVISFDINTQKNILSKFIVDWGYLENYHPLLTNRILDADSLFCVFTEDILKKNTYQLENLLTSLNNKLLNATGETLSGFKTPISTTDLLIKSINNDPALKSITNKRVEFNEESSQLIFKTTTKFTQAFPKVSFRILGLAKIWNNYRFYYPYQDIIPPKSIYLKLLTNYLSEVLLCKNALEYHLLILKFSSEFHDPHSIASSFFIKNQIGKRTIPIKVRYITGKVTVTGFYDSSLWEKTKLQLGDLIVNINNERIPKIFNRLKKYISFSNNATLFRDLANLSLKTNSDSIKIEIKRNGKLYNLTLATLPTTELFTLEQQANEKKSILKIDDSTLLIKCKYADTSYLREVFSNDKYLKWFIFDLRSSTKWIKPVIEDFFYRNSTPFALYYIPLPSAPGNFSDSKKLSIGPSIQPQIFLNPHVMILVNENTQSQGEFQTMFLQAIPNAITIGSMTAGTDGNTSEFGIPGNITITMTSLGIKYPDGKRSQNIGNKIDYYLKPRIRYYNQGIDQDLNFALDLIKKGGH